MALVGSVGAAACSLTALDGFTSGAPPAADIEGGVDASMRQDASPSDAMARPDSSDDCSGAALCDDFEGRSVPLGGPWDELDVAQGGSVEIVAGGRAGTRVLRVTAGPPTNASAALIKRIDDVKTIHLRYALRAEVPARTVQVGALGFSIPGQTTMLYLRLNDNDLSFVQQQLVDGKQLAYVQSPDVPLPNRWLEVDVKVDLERRKLDVLIDGEVAFTDADLVPLPSRRPNVHAGISYAPAGVAYSVELDDIRVVVTR